MSVLNKYLKVKAMVQINNFNNIKYLVEKNEGNPIDCINRDSDNSKTEINILIISDNKINVDGEEAITEKSLI